MSKTTCLLIELENDGKYIGTSKFEVNEYLFGDILVLVRQGGTLTISTPGVSRNDIAKAFKAVFDDNGETPVSTPVSTPRWINC